MRREHEGAAYGVSPEGHKPNGPRSRSRSGTEIVVTREMLEHDDIATETIIRDQFGQGSRG